MTFMEGIEFKQLTQTGLNTIEDFHLLFPHWRMASVQKKLLATNKRRDKRFVAIKEGKIVAHVRFVSGKGLHRHRVEVTSLIVDPKHRRQRLGSELMKFALKAIPKKKKLVMLSVDSKNNAAIDLYRKLGFEQYGLLKKAAFLNGKMVDNVLMAKEI